MPKKTESVGWYEKRIEYLSGFMLPERFEGFRKVLDRRTRYATVCMENTFHPQNASALVRNCEAFGLQEIHAVESLCKFRPNVNIVKGTDKWIEINRYKTTAESIDALKGKGYRIVVTSPRADGDTPESFDVGAGKFALVFGTEHAGVSDKMIEVADSHIRIPMCGFVESLNVSASAAILIYSISERLRRTVAESDWQLDYADRQRILFDWMMRSIKDSGNILARMEL